MHARLTTMFIPVKVFIVAWFMRQGDADHHCCGCPKSRILKTPDGKMGPDQRCADYKTFPTHIDLPMSGACVILLLLAPDLCDFDRDWRAVATPSTTRPTSHA
jgi:hypothetical protein